MIAISVFWEDYGRKGSHQMITTQDYSVCQTIRKWLLCSNALPILHWSHRNSNNIDKTSHGSWLRVPVVVAISYRFIVLWCQKWTAWFSQVLSQWEMIKGTQKPEVSLETKLEHFRIQKSSFPCMKSSPWIYSDRYQDSRERNKVMNCHLVYLRSEIVRPKETQEGISTIFGIK